MRRQVMAVQNRCKTSLFAWVSYKFGKQRSASEQESCILAAGPPLKIIHSKALVWDKHVTYTPGTG
jgi:hypothetical protein